jgi:hypothetical protein
MWRLAKVVKTMDMSMQPTFNLPRVAFGTNIGIGGVRMEDVNAIVDKCFRFIDGHTEWFVIVVLVVVVCLAALGVAFSSIRTANKALDRK